MVDQVSAGLGHSLLFVDLLSQAVRHGGYLARNAHGEGRSASDSSECGRGVHGKTHRSERGRIEENGLATALCFAIKPNWSTCRKRSASVDSVDSGIKRSALVPNGAVVVNVGEQIRVSLIECHNDHGKRFL
jgi:hypothetical protein